MPVEWACPNHSPNQKNYVGLDARGSLRPFVLIVGEAPGPQEYKQGYPFVGPSGTLLREYLARTELAPHCVFTNVVKHWPHEGRRTRTPTDEEVSTCLPVLRQEIEKFQPVAIIAVGDTAARALGAKGSIGQAEGTWVEVPGQPRLMPIYHTAGLLYAKGNPERYRYVERAITAALFRVSRFLRHGEYHMPDYAPMVPRPPPWGIPGGMAFDTETTSKSTQSQLLLISAATPGETPWVWHPEGVTLLGEEVACHNAPFDLPVMARAGSPLPTRVHDTLVLAWLLGERSLALKDLIEEHLHKGTMDYPTMMATPGWQVKTNYSAQDAVGVAHLLPKLLYRLRPEDKWYYETIAQPLLPILAGASVQGLMLDRGRATALLNNLWLRRASLLGYIRDIAGPEFNPASTPQMRKLLFETLGLPPSKKTKTGQWSTDDDVLTSLTPLHPVCSLVMGWRTADKLIGTYLIPMLRGDFVYTDYHLTGTETGRLASSDMNLQNLPAIIKALLRARPGYRFVNVDCDQIELKAAACLSQDATMLADIRNGVDLHARLASAVYGLAMDRIPKDLRVRAKSGNFERLYGGTIRKLAETLQVPEAKAHVHSDLFPGWDRYATKIAAAALREGYATTVRGRRRRLWDADSTSRYLQGKAEREAVNTPVQGSVADMVNQAIVIEDPWLHQLGGRFAHQEHDSILAEVPEGATAEAAEIITTALDMATPELFKQVPITYSVDIGDHWG